MASKITVTLLVVVVVLLAWPQYQKYQAQKKFETWAAEEQAREKAKEEEARQTICPGFAARGGITFTGICKDWKN